MLGRTSATSAAIGALMEQGVTSISADRDTLWIHRGVSDPGETRNLAAQQPARVTEMAAMLERIRRAR